MIETTRSRIAAWSICEQMWWWEAVANIEPTYPRLDATVSRCMHHGLKQLLKGHSMEAASRAAVLRWRGLSGLYPVYRTATIQNIPVTPELVEEQGALLEAQVRGFALFRYERLIEEFRVEEVETKLYALLADDVQLRIIPDALLVRRRDGHVLVLDFKSVDRGDARWRDAWPTDPQPYAYSVGVGKDPRFGAEKVDGFRVEMLPRGERRDGHQASPLVYGYAATAFPPHPPELTRTEKWGKATRFLVAKDLKAQNPVGTWLAHHSQVFRPMFKGLRVLPPDERSAARWVREVVETERRLATVTSAERPRRQGMNGGRCANRMGRCPFYDACWTDNVRHDPVGSGFYKKTAPRWEDDDEDQA